MQPPVPSPQQASDLMTTMPVWLVFILMLVRVGAEQLPKILEAWRRRRDPDPPKIPRTGGVSVEERLQRLEATTADLGAGLLELRMSFERSVAEVQQEKERVARQSELDVLERKIISEVRILLQTDRDGSGSS